ncbi:unnamed protein product [Ixodes pacificus]
MPPMLLIAMRWGWQGTGHAPSSRHCYGSAIVVIAAMARASTRMLVELSIIKSPDRVLTQCSGSIYEPHSNIVTGGYCDRQVLHQVSQWRD